MTHVDKIIPIPWMYRWKRLHSAFIGIEGVRTHGRISKGIIMKFNKYTTLYTWDSLEDRIAPTIRLDTANHKLITGVSRRVWTGVRHCASLA